MQRTTKKTLTGYKLLSLSQFLTLLVLGLVFLQTPLVVYLWSRFPQYQLYFKSLPDALILLNFGLVSCLAWQNRAKLKKSLRRDRKIVYLSLSFIFINILSGLLFAENLTSLLAGLVINARYILFFLTCLVLVKIDQKYLEKITKVVIGLGLIVGLFALLQVTILPANFLEKFGYSENTITAYQTIDQNQDYVRINSFLRGPNPLGALAVVLLALSLNYIYARKDPKKLAKSQLALLFLSLLILFFSHSRSAWLAGALVFVCSLVYWFKKSKKLVIVSLIASLILWVMGLGVLLVRDKNASLLDEIEFMLLHRDTSRDDLKSDEERYHSIEGTWKLIGNKPLLGHGVGSAGSASLLRKDGQMRIIENQFLMIIFETGLLGFGAFISLFVMVLWQIKKRQASTWLSPAIYLSGLGLALIALFLPVFVDYTVALTWWGLAGAVLGKTPKYDKNKA